MLPLLRTKTTIPPGRPKQIERAWLLERVSDGMRRALTLIVAPAGFGKTTLAAAWAQTAQIPVAWLSLQSADHAPERFLSYLIQALQTISPHLGQTTLALLHGGSYDGALFALVNDLAEVDGDFALFIDDYHSVDNPEIAKILQFLLEQRPASFHLALITRVAPSLSLTRLRALAQVTEISTADLRFTEDEVRAFLETSMDLCLPAEALAHLNQSTEGWVVGLQLAALALARQPENWHALAGQEHIFDYLAEEVLRRETTEVQDFLKVTALFDRFSVPLCDSILRPERSEAQSKGASALLAYTERANLFLVPLDSTRTWFRYHALFTDFLRRQVSDKEASSAYRLASQWFEQNEALDDAIHYATHAGDFERAAGLLEDHYIDMLQRGEQAALGEWIASMPPELLEKHPRLWLARGWSSVISLDSAQAEECVAKAEALIPPGETGDRLRGEAKSLRILTGIFAGKVAVAEEISETFVLLAEQDDFLHSLLHFNLGLRHMMTGETALAVDAFSETLRLTKALNNPLVTIVSLVMLGETRQVRGALGLAERTFQQVIRYAKETLGEHTFLLGMPYVSYAELLREQNRFDEALRYAEQGLGYCHIWQPIASLDGHIALSRLLSAQGCWDAAFSQLESAMTEAETSVSVIDDTFVAVQLARLALLQGNHAQAVQTIQRYDLENASARMYYHLRELAQLTLLRAKVAGLVADPSPALPLIEALSMLIAESERRERVTPVIEALILRSYAQHAAAKHIDAVESLSHALSLGAQSGYIRIFADEGRQLMHLLEQYRPQIHAPRSYFDRILKLLRHEAAQPVPPAERDPALSPATNSLSSLTRRELDILQLLAAGKSNQEIAAERVLTLNTVKKHVANILSKLGVANRTQAVMLARKSGWIE
jgi:LuxR family transcriptional regulator, maltose regulon positive regulatory protein